MKDEELQHTIEAGDRLNTSPDAEAYRKVFGSLKRETEFTLPSSFENLVIQRIAAQHVRESSRDGWWFAGGIFFLLIALVISLVIVDFKPGIGVYTFIKSYPSLIVFGIAFILLLNFIDRKFIRTTESQ